jgi:isoleucyl-tRNA synthetase
LPKQLGQKYGNKFPAIQKAILAMNAEEAAHTLLEENSLKVQANGESYDVLPDEVEVKALAKEGFAVAEEGAYVAALVTELTPALVQEGWRDLSAGCRTCARLPTWTWRTGSSCSSTPQPG